MQRISNKDLKTAVGAANAGGGFSVRAYGPQAGQMPDSAYMVGIPGYGEDFTPAATVAQARDFVRSRKNVLTRGDHFLGGWQGSNPQRTSLDVSRAFTPLSSKRAQMSARMLAVRGNQEAIGVVPEGGGYAGEYGNPFYQPNALQAGREMTTAERSWATDPVKRQRVGSGSVTKRRVQKMRTPE